MSDAARNAIATRVGGLDWGALAPLRIRSRLVAEGLYAGAHRSVRRGAGVEFGGYREYLPGDDLRFLDRRALLRHDRLLVRQFETETERALRIVVDATASMSYRGKRAPAAKAAVAAVLAAALARVVVLGGDPVGLSYIGGDVARPVRVGGGREVSERILGSLEELAPGGDATKDGSAMLDRALGPLARAARRGSVVVLFSDLLDLPDEAAERVASIGLRGRAVVVVQLLDPDEEDLPFDGTVRLRGLEGGYVVETDVDTTRGQYLDALADLRRRWSDVMLARGGRFVRATTNEDPVAILRRTVEAIR